MNKKKSLALVIAGISLLILQFLKYCNGSFAPPAGNGYAHLFTYSGYILGYNVYLIAGLILCRIGYKLGNKREMKKT
jgi:hypothetical protein